MRSRMTLSALAMIFMAASPAIGQNINLAPNGNPIEPFGQPGIATMGETFTAPSPTNVLQSFQFRLANSPDNGGNGGNLLFKGYVSEFDATNNSLVGPLLFQSAVTAGNGADSYVPYSFNTGFLTLDPTRTYIAFLSASGLTPTASAPYAFEAFEGTDDTNPRGMFVYSDNGNDFASLSSQGAFSPLGADAAFSAQFTVTPEPSEFLLLGSGMSGLIGFVRVRRRRATIG